MIGGKNITLLMDSHLDGKFSTEEATLVFELASQCLQYEPRNRPSIRELVAALTPLQNNSDVSGFYLFIYIYIYIYIYCGPLVVLFFSKRYFS